MSAETSLWLNTNTLIGMTANRGTAWHYRKEDQGEESNHYEGAIPVGDVERRLFHWDAVKVPVLAEFPADIETMTGFSTDGLPVRQQEIPGLVAIARSDNDHVFKIFTDGYEIHQYREWLLNTVSTILGDTLVITSAGLLKQGGQAWVEVSVPETLHDAETGFAFRPNLLAATSLDGSLSTTYTRTVTATVCDNTMAAALLEGRDQRVKIKHSRYSGLRIDEARESLSLIEQTADAFTDALHELTRTTVTDKQWFSFVDQWQKDQRNGKEIPEKGRGKAIAERERDELNRMYFNDVRANTWKGTAFGVVQAVNTWAHHEATVKGATRSERNAEGAITGKFDALDRAALATLDKILANA
ncbi:hypothetical protein SEA_SHAGRAT_38 [Rhodococcus phage Shagrat]|nr:hypothetical protein SEA_SHAGRAT_38 [Rhodococcus phage Shagrat]